MSKEYNELQKQMREIQHKMDHISNKEKLDSITLHKEYIGKCYKYEEDGVTKYYKIVGEYSENSFHMECFEFTLPLQFSYKFKHSDMYRDRYPDAEIDCNSFTFRSEGIFCCGSELLNKRWTEITKDEFNLAMKECNEELLKTINDDNLSNRLPER